MKKFRDLFVGQRFTHEGQVYVKHEWDAAIRLGGYGLIKHPRGLEVEPVPMTLEHITEGMSFLSGELDYEMAHIEADRLIVEAVKVMAPVVESQALLAAWEAVGKRYA